MNDHIQQPGIVLNSKTIGLMVGLITLLGAMFTVFDRVNSYDYRLRTIEATVESNEVRNKESTSELIREVKILNSRVAELTIAIHEIKVVNDVTKQNLINK